MVFSGLFHMNNKIAKPGVGYPHFSLTRGSTSWINVYSDGSFETRAYNSSRPNTVVNTSDWAHQFDFRSSNFTNGIDPYAGIAATMGANAIPDEGWSISYDACWFGDNSVSTYGTTSGTSQLALNTWYRARISRLGGTALRMTITDIDENSSENGVVKIDLQGTVPAGQVMFVEPISFGARYFNLSFSSPAGDFKNIYIDKNPTSH